MKIERFEAPGLVQYSYVVSDGSAAVVIDPARDIDRYTGYAVKHGLRIKHVVETHIHADYASGAKALAEASGAELALSGYDVGERYQYSMKRSVLKDGDSVAFGNGRLEALHTPGHTSEHLSFLLFETGADLKPVAMFSGDFLFAGSLGRPDLLGEAAKVGLAKELYRSITERIAGLPDELVVYPGHGAGSLCGSGMSDRLETTLGHERATNEYFGYSEEMFVEKILASVPPMPGYYLRMKELNAVGATTLGVLPGGTPLTVEAVDLLRGKSEDFLLDLRQSDAFWEGHIAGAVNIGGAGNLSLWAGWLIEADKQIVLIADEHGTEEARRGLIRVGLDHIAGYLNEGMAAWATSGREVLSAPEISVSDVSRLEGDALVLDVRTDSERASGYIAGSEHVMLGVLPGAFDRLPRTGGIITVCGSGYRSSIAASLLERAGFEDVRSMAGGMGEWKRQGFPVCEEQLTLAPA